jgi:sec-independent protein translocase protein TatA
MGFLGGIRGPELILILVIVMIVFGVGRLPEVGGALGKAIRQFRTTVSETAELTEEVGVEDEKEKEKTAT